MNWLDRLLGRDSPTAFTSQRPAFEPQGWTAVDSDTGAATSQAYLAAVAAKLGVQDARIVAMRDEYETELRGTLRGLPLRVTCDDWGEVHDVTLQHAVIPGEVVELEFDPDAPHLPALWRAPVSCECADRPLAYR